LDGHHACSGYHYRPGPDFRHQHAQCQDVRKNLFARAALADRLSFGESEVITASIKVLCFLGLVFVSLVITLGGAPNHDRIGFRYWNNPGAWTEYSGITGSTGAFLGFLSAFINASFSFIGVETVSPYCGKAPLDGILLTIQVVIAAAETRNPHRSIPKATKRVTYRILFFYVLGAILIGMIVPYDQPDLVSGSGNANSSPWVIGIKQAGIPALDSIVNVSSTQCEEYARRLIFQACILVSAWSAGNSYCYVGSRIIVAMAVDRQLPQFFAKVNRWGVPYYAVLVSFLFGPLAYLSESPSQSLEPHTDRVRSWIWWSFAGFLMDPRIVHRRGFAGLDDPVHLLPPLLRCLQSTRSGPKYTAIQESSAAVCRLGRSYWKFE
jgi:amino acid transporter